MAQCNVFYSSQDKGKVATRLKAALMRGDLQRFIDYLKGNHIRPTQVRTTPQEGDTESEVAKAMQELDRDIQDVLRGWDARHPTSTPVFDSALATIRGAFTDMDGTQSETITPDIESKTKNEVSDKNAANLQQHIAEFYGAESFDIVSRFTQEFEDMLASAAYYDVNSGTISDQRNETLNSNIRQQKARLFKTLVQYLKRTFPMEQSITSLSEEMYDQSGRLDSKNYYGALSKFYSFVATAPDFRNNLQLANTEKTRGTSQQEKIRKYKALVAQLDSDETFTKRMKRKFAGERWQRLHNQLYTADHYSEYYAAVKKYITESHPNLLEAIEDIERSDMTILDAANAYTMLRHFDSLLKEVYGDQLSIAQGTANYEGNIPDKYSYHADTAHERKGWQTSEDIGSEKHTSRFTNAVIKMIRVYDYKTGEFLHRRADSTSLIVASRNLINAVLTNKVSFPRNTDTLKRIVPELETNIRNLHADPVVRLQRILELLFERQPGMSRALVFEMENRQTVNDYDLSMLKSLYDVVFNKNLEQSFWNQSLKQIRSNSTATQSLLEEIAGFVDRNITASYLETTYDFETGTPTVRAKKKYFNNKQLYKTQTSINDYVNTLSGDARQKIQDKYNLQIIEDGSTNTRYQVTIGGEAITLRIPNQLQSQILGKNLKSGPKMSFEAPDGLFQRLNEINLTEFRYKIENNLTLNNDEQLLRTILEFLDDTLDLGVLSNPNLGLQTLYSYKELYNPIEGMRNYLMPLLKLGMRAAYANKMYLNAGERGLAKYLTESQNAVYAFHQRDRKSKVFNNRLGNLRYQIASYADEVLNTWVDAQSILRGEASKATTKDKQGNSIPNNSVAKLGGILHYYLAKQYGTNTQSLLFATHPELIKETFHDLEVTNMQNESKSVRSFSPGELFFHAIFNKFWGSYLQNGTVIVQPTTYSDKTTFLNWELNTVIDGVDIVRAKPEAIIQQYIDTIGRTYRQVYESTTQKLRQITTQWASEHGVDPTTDFRDIMHQMTEQDLVRTAARMGLTVELNKDYRIIKNKEGKSVLGVNDLLEYNAHLYTSPVDLTNRLRYEQRLFLQQMLLNGCTYQVLEGNDTLDMYTDSTIDERATSRNPVIQTIKSVFSADQTGRVDYMLNWVDSATGKLILAKQGTHNIITVSDDYDRNADVQLNPLFEKFFLVEGLLSNNLRYSLTGFEVNHPAGKKSPLTKALKVTTLEGWNQLGYGVLSVPEWNVMHNAEGTGVLDTILDADDLNRVLSSGIIQDPRINEQLVHLLEDTYTYETNTSQGTQFKRNVIIPATLQYCMQGVKDGIPPKVKCAVIRDEGAPVFNYRGDTESIDACDGSAQITPFQSIMENKSLGSQAVGFIKKPIWHSYDSESGTAFLAKFATDTMTNEAMRMSVMSNTRLFNLFKKATNLQWDPADEIDLTKSLIKEQSFGGQAAGDSDTGGNVINDTQYNQWFKSVILGGHNLYYQDKYGTRIEIISLNKTKLQSGQTLYYTLEKSPLQDKAVKKYHIFYDDVLPDGSRQTSIHITADSYQQAVRMMAELNEQGKNAHTINSLFELHTALGSIYCVDSNGNGSEFNNEVVVNFMNNVGRLKPGVSRTGTFVNQETYEQPLKKYHIGYLLNSTAVKNGAKNINPSSAWTDDSALTYFEVDSDGLGMQMNADHDIINAELTEFSQVIAATSAYGYTFDQCYEIFQGLARTALQASKKTLDSVDNFLQSINTDKQAEALSNLYDSVGRIILLNQSIKSTENLTNIIMQAVQKVFNKYKDHSRDEAKIPFSDPNIYSDFIATLASTITRQSIKRTHPGSGCVMVPAYNMIQYFEVYGPNGTEKLMASDIIKRARGDYRNELFAFLRSQENYDSSQDALVDGENITPLSTASTAELEQLALSIDNSGAFSQYYTPIQTNTNANQHLIRVYLEKQEANAPTFQDTSYFMPSDIVDVLDAEGNVIETVELDSLQKYYQFKDGLDSNGIAYPEGVIFRASVRRPHNLRPSLIRWQYQEADGTVHYKNIFDVPAIRNAYINGTNRDANYRTQVQNALHEIQAGYSTDSDGIRKHIIEGTLENEEAELVMSNLYKDIFNIGDESLSEVLAEGANYFLRQVKELHAPVSSIFDIAFLRDNGKHTLITIGNVNESPEVTPDPFTNTMTNDDDEIVAVRGGRELYKIGKWADVDNVQYDSEANQYVTNEGKVLDPTQYRIKEGRVQKRYDFITRYNVVTKKLVKGKVTYQTNTLYKIADVETIKQAFKTTRDSDAIRQQAALVLHLYEAGDYKLAEINAVKKMSEGKRHAVANALQFFLTNTNIDKDVKDVIRTQISESGDDVRQNKTAFRAAKRAFMERKAHEKWVSFQDSLKFISARIPAQTLQSFMAMRLVAWTENSNNMAYVSHFQTYLQGSDYDIDKAYVMGQSYDANSLYVKWSPYFDYTSLSTLEASKALPVPKGIFVNQTENGVDITAEIDTIVANSRTPEEGQGARLNTDGLTVQQKLNFLYAMGSALKKIEKNGGNYSYHGTADKATLGYVLSTFIGHERYNAPDSVAEAAFKNVASANIYAVSHDIRNRDQAYTPISMDLMRAAAERSPKGEQAAHLNMLNPWTKYIMQYQNLVGKDVIGISANGEKYWFNAYYYWTQALNMGNEDDLHYLSFSTTLTRVKDRAKGTRMHPTASTSTTTHLPDLDIRNAKISQRLLEDFGATEESTTYRYVDQLISQLLSSATDNAKELILAKINAGTNFARMYLYLMTMGYDINDIAAFMTSPIAEFIDARASLNMFQPNGNISSQGAINSTFGLVNSKQFLHGTISEFNEETQETETRSKDDIVGDMLYSAIVANPKFQAAVYEALGIPADNDISGSSVDQMMSGVIMAAVTSPRSIDPNVDVNLLTLLDYTSGDTEISNYLRYCQDLIVQLRGVKAQYGNDMNALTADAKEYKKIYDLASEMSTIASAYLGLNQGLPTDELSILKRLNSMRRVVTDRERAMGIWENELFAETKNEAAENRKLAAWDRVLTTLMDNNPLLDEDTIRKALTDAHEAGIMNHFEPYKMMTDENYRQVTKDYLHVIKGTVNVMDMVYKIPHYKQIMECFKALLVANQSLSVKSRLINELIGDATIISDQQLRGIVRYVDKLNILDFVTECPVVTTHKTVEGFNPFFETITTDHFDLSTIEGISGFKHFIETEFLEYLKSNYADNPLVKHLKKITSEGRTILSTDTDLLSPNTTTASRIAYDDILRGTAMFEGVYYGKDESDHTYTIADLLQLYNLIINSNQYGDERLTTAFKACSNPNSVLQKYFAFIASRDHDFDTMPEYNQQDYQINAAPVVSPSAVRFHREPYIKVKDPIWDYVLMEYNSRDNSYSEKPLLPALYEGNVDAETQTQRKINYMENCPFEMPNRAKALSYVKAINYTGEVTPEVLATVRGALTDLSLSGKVLVLKIC